MAVPQSRLSADSQGLLGLVDKASLIGTWARFYARGLGYKDAYVRQGARFQLVWRVTTAIGAPMRRQAVTLLANKGYGGSTATFRAGHVSVVNTAGAKDGARIPGVTDANGYVRFSLTDTSRYAEPASTPTGVVDKVVQETGAVYGQFALLIGKLPQGAIALDLVDVHIVAAVDADPATYAANLPIGRLLWSDEFTGPAGAPVDSATWTARYCGLEGRNGGGACSNDESQYYLPSAVALDGSPEGAAVITTTHISSPPAEGSCLGSICEFTSGRFDTQGKVSFQYGFIEARIKMPVGGGNWPAFWMLGADLTTVGWPYYGEIDIAESAGSAPNTVTGSMHYTANHTPGSADASRQYHVGGAGSGADYTADFHRYAIAWLPDRVSLYVDGQRFFTIRNYSGRSIYWPFNEPFFLIFDNAVTYGNAQGGAYTGWSSSQMSIDWVRQYQLDGRGEVFRQTP